MSAAQRRSRRIAASGTMVLDRRSLSYAALGLGPSWMLLDGLFSEVALFDRTQPEGLALATYLTAVSAVANTIVVPGHAVVQRRVQWSLRTWVGGAVYAQLATALVLAAFWHERAGGASIAAADFRLATFPTPPSHLAAAFCADAGCCCCSLRLRCLMRRS